ncbi:hypothetical protein C9374_010438 [Naegleria lovaniensis]|uniref:Uncharacterized protein n=1 Tax=Naegleria lovaniensis TaxID=51637 RepID=A0AA88GG68_NAELO|nr:uncharacterized protein C9374_010438 [Naegleria lovaniensis]KAG2374694.1 hypothetical protein C9374_010438 [Naegleria lovaniensis]
MVKVKHYFTMSCEDWTKYLQQEFIQEGDPEFITETYQDTLDQSYMTANVWMKVVEIEDKPTSISLQHSTLLSIHNESISFLTITCKEQQISSENMLLFFFAKSFLTQICNKSIEIKCGRIRYRSKNCEEVKLTCDQVVFSKDERELPMAIFSLHGEVPRSKLCELFQHSIPTQIKIESNHVEVKS